MAIRSHGRGRGGTVGHGRLEESDVPSGAFFASVHVCNSCRYNKPCAIPFTRIEIRKIGNGKLSPCAHATMRGVLICYIFSLYCIFARYPFDT